MVGGGPVGLSTAHMCAKEGKTVAILEKYVLYNASGSSADFMRMFRTMYTEDYMVSNPDPGPEPQRDPYPNPNPNPIRIPSSSNPNPNPNLNPKQADLAHEAISQWDALERESGERMIERTGLLNFGNPKYVSEYVWHTSVPRPPCTRTSAYQPLLYVTE